MPFRADYAVRSSDHEYIALLRYTGPQPEGFIWTMTIGRAQVVRSVSTAKPSTPSPATGNAPTASPLANTGQAGNHHDLTFKEAERADTAPDFETFSFEDAERHDSVKGQAADTVTPGNGNQPQTAAQKRILYYKPNPSLPHDQVEADSAHSWTLDYVWREKPAHRPVNIPKDYVLVQVMWYVMPTKPHPYSWMDALGWVYLSAEDVNWLHRRAEPVKGSNKIE